MTNHNDMIDDVVKETLAYVDGYLVRMSFVYSIISERLPNAKSDELKSLTMQVLEILIKKHNLRILDVQLDIPSTVQIDVQLSDVKRFLTDLDRAPNMGDGPDFIIDER